MASKNSQMDEEFGAAEESGGEQDDFESEIEFHDSSSSNTPGNPPFFTAGLPLFPTAPLITSGLPPSANAINWNNYNMTQHAATNGSLGETGPTGTVKGAAGSPAGGKAANKMAKHELMYGRSGGSWDPSHSADWDGRKPGDLCLGRIARDLHSLYTDPIPGVMVHADDTNVTKMKALLTGPEGTPYQGGFFEFYLRFPPEYPITSPRVKFMTTGGGTVRFNPNLYSNGKVCLSLLGTWTGPAWSPALNTSSLLLSIQSLMGEYPYRNEPGFEKAAATDPSVVNYNINISHETIRVAVIGMVERTLAQVSAAQTGRAGAGDYDLNYLPESFAKVILDGFLKFYDRYLDVIEQNKHHSGKQLSSAMCERHITHNWLDMKAKLPTLKVRVQAQVAKMRQLADLQAAVDLAEDEKD